MMRRSRGTRGFSLIEVLVSLAIFLLAMTGLASLLIQNARVNKSQQMTAEVQANARNTLSMVVQKLRSAGWDPRNNGFPTLNLDPDDTDDVAEIEIFADLNADDDVDDLDEQILIRHLGATNQVVWRRTNNVADPFIILSTNISNDADGDGTIEPMFVPNDPADPTIITVQVTAQSPVVDPTSRQFIRYTVSSDVVLRKEL